ncbi:MAG: pyruvate dehydrogenase E2 component (dihydrolipoamide acetyltransferase) [Bacteroidia bacterium]|jgi:pyruvate dehydrogenase E2 component (dihydrolipoamide acetyltransferase)
MAVAIKLPKMSDTMEEGVIVSWQVKVGDEIKLGDILAEVETDKATMDLDNYEKGTVLHINAEEGQTIPVDSVILVVGKKGEDYAGLLTAAPTKKAKTPAKEETAPVVTSAPVAAPVVAAPTTVSTSSSNGRILASPLAKKIAADKGVDINQVSGTGDGGRIIKKDIENYTPSVGSSVTGVESFTTVPVSQMRKTIARRLGESKFTAPHFYLTMEIRMDNAITARKEMNEYSDVKISMNDVIVKAASVALRRHPKVNAAWMGDSIRMNNHIHVGVAMAVDEGLLVPVVRFADSKSLSQISTEVKAYSAKAKDKKLQPNDWEGNTFTISNLGMFGIEEFTAIINSPDACIMAVGAAKETVVVDNGEMKVGNVMKVTLSCDHRVVDGVVGSQFLQTFKTLMENPVKLLV